MHWLLGRLNFYELAEDDLYGAQYFLEKFAAWTSYQISGAVREISPPDARSFEEIARILKRANRVLVERLREIYHCRSYFIRQQREPQAEGARAGQAPPVAAGADAPAASAVGSRARPRRKSSPSAR